MSDNQKKTNWGQFIPLVSVFFFWGFVAASNDILIPVFKKAFSLTPFQSQFVSLFFYVAYTVGSIIYMIISKVMKIDFLLKVGYKNGICLGLIISALGTLTVYSGALLNTLNIILLGLFIVGIGFSLQQIAANPLAIVMGDPKTGSQRLTMAGGINNLGTTIGPLLVSMAIFGLGKSSSEQALNVDGVKLPYLVLTIAFLAVATFIKFSNVPNKIDLEHVAEEEAQNEKLLINKPSALSYPQLILGMIAIFLYVGVEVSSASNLPSFLEQKIGVATSDVAPYVSLYWASLMIGRWTGAVGAFDFSMNAKKILKFIAPYLAFLVFIFVNTIAKHDISQFYPYAFVIAVMLILDILSKGNPAKMLLYFSLAGVIASVLAMTMQGKIAVYSIISCGLFCSTLWPCIFTLAITGLGKSTNQGSSLLIMMIMGGGFISALQGKVSESIGIQHSYIVGAICFAYLAFYAVKVSGILKSQGIDLDKLESEGGH